MLQNQALYRIGIHDDGDCFLRAVHLRLDQDQDDERILALRTQMCHWMEQHFHSDPTFANLLHAELQSNNADMQPLQLGAQAAVAYIARTRAGSVKLYAMVCALKCTIALYPSNPNLHGQFVPQYYPSPPPEGEVTSEGVVRILALDHHYELLIGVQQDVSRYQALAGVDHPRAPSNDTMTAPAVVMPRPLSEASVRRSCWPA